MIKKYLFLIFVILLLFSIGCKKATVYAPVADQPKNESRSVNQTNQSMPEVPAEWKGKTIKDILQSTVTSNGTINQSMISQTANNPAYNVSKGTYIVEARKTLSSMVFFPKELKIKTGDTVRFINALDYQNKQAKIIFYSYLTGVFRSEELGYNEYLDHTFDEKGNFTYSALPYQSYFKKGTIVVE
jgi:plastocyanin